MKLTIIIPVFNEEKTLSEIIRKVKSVDLGKLQREIIVVDDCSTDKTSQIAKKISGIKYFKHKINKGKGAAVRTGIKNASGDIMIIQDADLEYDPTYFKKLLKPILSKKAKVVYGSRLKNLDVTLFGKHRTPLLLHFFGNKLLTAITNILYGSNITDMETCYKVFTSDVIQNLNLESNRFEIEPEITAKILKKGIKITEIPIKVSPRDYSEGKKITWKDGFGAVGTLVKYKFLP